MGFEGLVGSEDTAATCFGTSLSSSADPDEANKQKLFGSGQLRQERAFEDDWRCCLKVAKTEDFSASKAMLTSNLLRSSSNPSPNAPSPFLLSENGQQMLSFSSPNSQPISSSSSPYYQYQPASSPYNSRNTGYGYGGGGVGGGGVGGLNAQTIMYGMRGPFTPSQWMELEHQALIYKYITANAPIPSNLLIPIRKALDSAGFYASAGPLRSNAFGWGGFHLGFSNSTDPEPGRCRRTDGKKWRCSRDAVPDQKYCERHLNRGRHRSRKPVEGLTGHSVSGTATAKASPAAVTAVTGGGSGSNSLCQSGVPPPTSSTNPSPSSHLNRSYLNKENGKVQDKLDLSSDNQYSVSTEKSVYRNSSNQQHPVRQFMDGWPSSQPDCSAFSWTNVDEIQPERTQLSISIPMASDFMSSTSSPVSNKKCPLSPLRLSTQMGLGVSMAAANEDSQRQANWIPISWGSSIGGPLGEVLNKTNNNSCSAVDLKNSSALNLMTDGWDHSPRQTSSPTGVLQKVPFGSLSNSSAGSSPRAESSNNRTREGASVCNYHHLAQPM